MIATTATHSAFAQTVITGRVTDALTDEPLTGATLVPKSSKELGTVTDYDGNFILSTKVQLPLTLSVQFVGYRSQEIDVYDASEPVDIQLTETRNRLSEVIVVGYGTQKRTQLTGSVASISAEQLQVIPAPTLDAALGGVVTGVDVTKNGQP